MRLLSRMLYVYFVSLPVLCSAGSPEEISRSWLNNRKPSGLVLVRVFEEQSFAGKRVARTNRVSFNLRDPNWSISLGFKALIHNESSLQDVRDSFSYIALDSLPTPGLEIEGWEIKPRTPTSSFSEGVEILDYRDGHITLRVKTNFFALYGRDKSVIVPADARSPRGSYFSIRQPLDLDMTIVAPIEQLGD